MIRSRSSIALGFCGGLLAFLLAQQAFALITGGAGNVPLDDPGWFKGAAAVFNDRTRIAHWEGPPFGGDEWHGEYKGDADDLQRMIDAFAQVEAPARRVVIHDGTAESFWLSIGDDTNEHPMDWTFTVWTPERFEIQRGWSVGENAEVPPPQIDVYTGRGLDWSAIVVPEGIEVVDQTLAGHGFTTDDGVVLEGTILEVGTNAGLPEATVTLELIEPQEAGGYVYTDATSVETDANGHWVLTSTPAGWYQIVVSKAGFVSRNIGYGQFEDEPGWHPYSGTLAPAVEIDGVVVNSEGEPLAGARVRLGDMTDAAGEPYGGQGLDNLMTDDQGQFSAIVAEGGQFNPWAYLDGYVHVGLPDPFEVGTGDVRITLHQSGNLQVVVDFSDRTSTGDYLIEIEPEGGSVVGSWGGSATVDADGSYFFDNVPPGRYTLKGRPNPGSTDEETAPKTIDVVAGETTDVVLIARP